VELLADDTDNEFACVVDIVFSFSLLIAKAYNLRFPLR